MLSWDIHEGVINEVRYRDEAFTLPWGIETADTSGFFSLEKGVGYRHKRIKENHKELEGDSRFVTQVEMPDGVWLLTIEDSIKSEKVIVRTAYLEALEDTLLMDFVMRFRFKKKYFESAEIAGNMLVHRASDVYHQYPVRSAQLNGSKFSVNIIIENSIDSEVMSPNLYVRDHADEWVVHARMIPLKIEKVVVKICNSWAKTRALPDSISRPILGIPGVRNFLWYRNERKPYPRILKRLFNPNAFPMAKLTKGDTLFWRVKMEIL